MKRGSKQKYVREGEIWDPVVGPSGKPRGSNEPIVIREIADGGHVKIERKSGLRYIKEKSLLMNYVPRNYTPPDSPPPEPKNGQHGLEPGVYQTPELDVNLRNLEKGIEMLRTRIDGIEAKVERMLSIMMALSGEEEA